MLKRALPLLMFAALVFASAEGDARPCNQIEAAAHKNFGMSGECFKPDPHPMPGGIAWPGSQATGDSYIYFINSSPKPVKLYDLAPEEEGGDPVAYHLTTLPPGSYTWEGLAGFGDYALIAGKSRVNLDEEREYLYKEGPAIYKFYNLGISNGQIQYRKITETEAIKLMKAMKYAPRKPNGERVK